MGIAFPKLGSCFEYLSETLEYFILVEPVFYYGNICTWDLVPGLVISAVLAVRSTATAGEIRLCSVVCRTVVGVGLCKY
jgi:hypothetical protein